MLHTYTFLSRLLNTSLPSLWTLWTGVGDGAEMPPSRDKHTPGPKVQPPSILHRAVYRLCLCCLFHFVAFVCFARHCSLLSSVHCAEDAFPAKAFPLVPERFSKFPPPPLFGVTPFPFFSHTKAPLQFHPFTHYSYLSYFNAFRCIAAVEPALRALPSMPSKGSLSHRQLTRLLFWSVSGVFIAFRAFGRCYWGSVGTVMGSVGALGAVTR